MGGSSSLKDRAVRGFAWVTIFSFISRGVQFLAFLVLAKLLVPEDFGVLALGMALINALIMFREMGLTPALIQRQTNIEAAFSAGFILLPVYGLALFIIIYFLAVPFSRFVNNPEVIPIIRVLGLSAPISSLGILPSAWFQRELDFKRKVIPETFSAVIGSGLSVLWAYWNWGVWSLVWGKIATESLRTIFYWLASGLKWRPKWDLNEAKQLFQFGSLVSLGSVTAFLYYIVDQTLVGKYMGEKAIGFYSFAFRISTLPVTGLTILLGSVMLPVMSKLQNDAPQLARAVGKNISINALITIPFSIGLFFFGGDLLNLLYGDKWRGAVVLLQILSIYAVLWALIGPLNNVYIARGKAGYFPLIATLKLILAMLAMVWAIPQGNPEAVALAFTLAALICHIYGFYLGARLVQKSIWYLLNFITPYIIGIIPGYLGLKLAEALEMGLVVRMLSFFIPYLGCLLILGREMIKEVTKLVKDTFIAKFA